MNELRCQTCGKTTTIAAFFHGWWQVQPSDSLFTHVAVDGQMLTDFPFHFCSFACLAAWARAWAKREVAP